MPTKLNSYLDLTKKCSQTLLVLPKEMKKRKLVIVGESLGRNERDKEEYFVGKAGLLLDKLLKEIGIMRDLVHITNVVKVYIPSTNDKEAYLNSIGLSIQDFIPYLKEELELIQPKAILALGGIALEALTTQTGITKWRGSILECTLTSKQYPVVATLHPSYLQRGQMMLYPYVRNDIKRFAEVGYNITKPDEDFNQLIDPTLTQIIDYLHDIKQNSTETCIDIETVARQRITCVGFSKDENNGICIPFRYNGLKNRWSEGEQIFILKAMKEVYQKPNLLKIGQNFHYDMHYLLPLLGFPREPLFDTMYAHQLIHPDARHDLGFLISVYTLMRYHKDEAKDWDAKTLPHDTTLWQYNVKDIIGTHRVYKQLIKELTDYNLLDFFRGYVMPFRRVIFEMEWRGIRVDLEKRKKWTDFIVNKGLPIALNAIKRLTGQEINPNSSKQLGTYLETKLGIYVKRTTKGNYTVKEEVLEDLMVKYPQHKKILKLILHARVMKAKDLGTYLTAPLSPDNRMRSSYGVTVTGRLTSKSNHHGEGTNQQNQPKKFRKLFLPEIGHKLLEPDLSQAEAFAMVFLMKNHELKRRMLNGEKIHNIVGEWIYKKDYKTLTAIQYLRAKRTVHGSNYNIGERKYAQVVKLPVAQARILREKYHNIVPELRQYHQWVRNEMDTKRRLITFYGRQRIFTGILDDDTYRSGYAQLPQSTVVDTLNLGTLGLWLIKPDDIHILTQIHDSIPMSIPPKKVEWFKPYIKAHLETLREIEINNEILVIPCDIGRLKDNWLGK